MKTQPTAKQSRTEGAGTHTPTPWEITGSKIDIACAVGDKRYLATMTPIINDDGQEDIKQSEADAAFIVKAVNCHEELLATLQGVLSELRWTSKNGQFPGMDKVIEDADKTIAKAEGK